MDFLLQKTAAQPIPVPSLASDTLTTPPPGFSPKDPCPASVLHCPVLPNLPQHGVCASPQQPLVFTGSEGSAPELRSLSSVPRGF